MIRFNSVRSGFVVACAAGTLFASAAPGRAQILDKVRPISLKVGVLFPTTSSKIVPNNADVNYGSVSPSSFSLGASYDLGKTRVTLRPLVYSVYADVFTESSASRSDDGSFSDSEPSTAKAKQSGYGLGVMGRIYPLPMSRLYAGAGLGIYPMQAKVSFSFGGSYSHTETGLGGKLFVGMESKMGVFGELEWDKLPDVSVHGEGLTLLSSHMSGLRVNVGYRL